jgi:DNA invertase Pin-like site-specific DNA recombinase
MSGYDADHRVSEGQSPSMSVPSIFNWPNIDVGYARVSTDDQDCSLQREALIKSGVHPEYIFTDMSSGRSFKRDGLITALKMCIPRGQVEKFPEGSTFKFWKLDRLGRDLVELIMTVNRLDERGVRFMSLTEPHICTEARHTAAGRAFFNMTAMYAEMESLLIGERTRAGQRSAKARGVQFGKKTFQQLYLETGRVAEFQREYAASGDDAKSVAKRLKIPEGTWKKGKHVFLEITTIDIDGVLPPLAGETVTESNVRRPNGFTAPCLTTSTRRSCGFSI